MRSLFSELRGLNVTLWNNEGRLRYRAPDGPLPPDLRAEVVARKQKIPAHLSDSEVQTQLATITPAPADQAPQVSFSQQRLWFHESLRTRFQEDDGLPVPVIDDSQQVPLPTGDLQHLPTAEHTEGHQRLVDEENLRPFDLANEPLVRAM